MAWWPHAIGSWTNPFVTHVVYAPTGVNIAWTPTAPGLALAFSPLTVLVGPVVSYNVAMVLMPALAAWTTYLLCRYVTGSLWASIVGGLLFGFSTAELRQVQPGFLNLAGVFLFPLVALLILRYVRNDLDGRGLALRLGFALALQLTISTEFAAQVAIAIALCLALGFLLVPDRRRRIRSSLVPVVGAYLLSALLVAPFVYYLVSGFQGKTVVDDIDLWALTSSASSFRRTSTASAASTSPRRRCSPGSRSTTRTSACRPCSSWPPTRCATGARPERAFSLPPSRSALC